MRHQVLSTPALASRDKGKETSATPEVPGISQTSEPRERELKSVIRDGIIVGVEQAVKLDIRMEMGALEENITVIGRSPLIDVKNTAR